MLGAVITQHRDLRRVISGRTGNGIQIQREERAVRRKHLQMRIFGIIDQLGILGPRAHQQLSNSAILRAHAVKFAAVALRIGIDEEHALIVILGKNMCHVAGGDCLAYAALYVHNCDCFHG